MREVKTSGTCDELKATASSFDLDSGDANHYQPEEEIGGTKNAPAIL